MILTFAALLRGPIFAASTTLILGAALLATPVLAQNNGSDTSPHTVSGAQGNNPDYPQGLRSTATALQSPTGIAPAPKVLAELAPDGTFNVCDTGTQGDFTAVGTVVFDTDALTYGGAPGGINLGGVAVYYFDSISIPLGTSVRGVGSRPWMLVAADNVDVAGSVDANGASATPTAPSCQAATASPGGPGGSAGGMGGTGSGAGSAGSGTGAGTAPVGAKAGGGGASFGGLGGAGGANEGAGGTSGPVYGDLFATLDGGSGGGSGSVGNSGCSSSSGGGGGGALKIVGGNVINVIAGGVISASGGNGALSDLGGSGGGSGGGIILQAPSVINDGTVRANGGSGASGGCCGGGGAGGGGRVLIVGTSTGAGTSTANAGGAGSGTAAGAAGAAGTLDFAANLGLSISKTDGASNAVPGASISYQIVVRNDGLALSNVPVTDTFPALMPGATFSATATGGATGFSASGAAAINDLVTLPAGSTISYTVTGTVIPSATGNLSNRACAGPTIALDIDALTPQADLSITLSDSPDPVVAGNQLTYVAMLTNGGISDAAAATISLPLPSGTSFVSATPSAGGSCNAASPVVCTWAGATAPGGTHSASIVVLVAPSVLDNTVLSATATASSSTTDPTPGNNTASANTTVNAIADLSITLVDSPDPVVAGNQLTYVAMLTNGGVSDTASATVSLPLPSGTSFVSATPGAGGSCNAASPVVCSWAAATPPGGTRSVSIVVLVAPSVPDNAVLSATATASSSTTDPTSGNNAATTTTTVNANADLSITLSDSPDPVVAGNQLTYVAMLTNGGLSEAVGTSISLPLPSGTSFVSATPSAGGLCNAASPVVCSWAGVTTPGGTRSVSIVVLVAENVLDGTLLSATATASSTTTDPTSSNNTASTSTTVNASADLSITLTASPNPVIAGTELTYVATLTNAGPSDASNAAISLSLAPATSFVSAAPDAGGSCNSASPVVCTWSGATSPGATRSVSIVVLVGRNVQDGIGLDATATASSITPDPTPGNNAMGLTVVTAFTARPIPTLDQWGLLLLGLLLAGVSLEAVRRRA